jgi:hypothetical protein
MCCERIAASAPGEAPSSRTPPIAIVPLVGRSRPPIRCMSVVLPLPLSPTIATYSPRATLTDTPSSARTAIADPGV